MTTVLPAWKVELIEKKKRKEQDQRQKLEQEKSRKTSIPEWKRSLLVKKKESTIDSPATREQALHVNTLFGPRIVRKVSQTNTLVVNSACKPVVKNGEEEKKKIIFNDINTSQGGPALCSSPADINSCVTKGVEIPTELEHKPNKLGIRIEIESNQQSSQQWKAIANGEDLKATLNDDPSVLNPGNDIEHIKTPSVFNYRRIFEHSKPAINGGTNVPRYLKNTESKARVQSDKKTVESAVGAVNGESHQPSSQLQILTTSAVDNVQSIPDTDNSSNLPVDSIGRKPTSQRPFVAPKPYKNFVVTPPWPKHGASKNSAYLAGKEDLLVTNGDVHTASKDFDNSDHKKDVVLDFKGEHAFDDVDKQAQRTKFNDHSDLIIPCMDSQRVKALQSIVPQKQSLHKYLLVKDADSKEEVESFKSDKNVENEKYILMEGKSQQESIPSNNMDTKVASATINNISQLPHESETPKADEIFNASSIESLRSKFGAVGGFRKRTPSEENLFLSGNQYAPLNEQGCVIRRSAELKRPVPPLKRWSADVLSLMSKPIDDNDDGGVSSLSPCSDTKSALSSANSLPKRPPGPTKRWTADVMSVVSPWTDGGATNFSPTSDSSKKSSPSFSLERGKSSSLIDVREDAINDCFQHKSNVAHGIEHRVNKLIRRASVSDLLLVDDEESDSTSEDDPISEAYLHGTFENEITSTDHVSTPKENDVFLPAAVHSPDQDTIPVFARKCSVSSDIEHRVTELLHRQLSQQSDVDDSEEDKILESVSKVSVVQMEDSVKESIPVMLKTAETLLVVETKPVTPIDLEPTEGFEQVKPAKGSVHKLSALFGSSVWRPNKKDKSANEENSMNKVNNLDRSFVPMKSSKKSSSENKVDSKKSNLFNRSNKTEVKSGQKEKQQSIFPWMKKNSKEKEGIASRKTKEYMDKNQENSSSPLGDNSETVSLSSHGLRPVGKTGKVEQRLVGNVVIISNASHDHTPPMGVYHKPKTSVQISAPEQKEMSARKVNHSKSEEKKVETCAPAAKTQDWNGNSQSSEVERSMSESVPITSIDEVPVSAIDIPELPQDGDVTVSVIDVPPSPDVRSAQNVSFMNCFEEKVEHTHNDVSVSVIDVPSPVIYEQTNTCQGGYLETDELSDDSDADDVEGSYDFATGEVTHLVNSDTSEDEEDGKEEEEEDDDETEEDVPISYIGAAPQYPVPQVVFDSEPVQLKSCLSPKTERRRVNKVRVSFKSTHTIHDYPSEETVVSVYDEYQRNGPGELKTLQNYQPPGLVNMEKQMGQMRGHFQDQMTTPQQADKRDITVSEGHSEIKYADEGQGFTDSTDYASALLF